LHSWLACGIPFLFLVRLGAPEPTLAFEERLALPVDREATERDNKRLVNFLQSVQEFPRDQKGDYSELARIPWECGCAPL
jgi:hypothetical protein